MFNIGDWVKVKDNLTIYKELPDIEDGERVKVFTGIARPMLKYRNCVGKVINVFETEGEHCYILDIDNEDFIWFEENLEIFDDNVI